MPHRLPPDRRPRHWFIPLSNSFELALACAGILATIQFFLSPETRGLTSAGKIADPFPQCWTAMYFAGSSGIIYGLLRADDRFEIAGLILFSVATLVNAAALLQARSVNSAAFYISVNFAFMAVAAWIRIYMVFRVRRALGAQRVAEE